MRVVAALAVAHALPAFDAIEDWVQLAQESPEQILELLEDHPGKAIVPDFTNEEITMETPTATGYPVVLGHGMGDSCFNPVSMERVTKQVAKMTNSFAVCVPTGSNLATDSANGYFLGVPESIDRFAAGIRSHPELKNGFDAIGFSQGNTLIRGYIEKYNNPPVRNFLSVHGTVMGVAAVPGCSETNSSSLCKTLSHALGAPAYTEFIQRHIFQAGYLRDPKRITSEAYLTNSELAKWNNEGKTSNSTFKSNFGTIKTFAMVMAKQDTMVEPKEGEHWAAFDKDFNLHAMRDTDMYHGDNFGLKTADSAKKIFFEETEGNHLQFSLTQLQTWINKYLQGKEDILFA